MIATEDVVGAGPGGLIAAATTLLPSFRSARLAIVGPLPGRPTNPSVTRFEGAAWLVVRLTNYQVTIDRDGRVGYDHDERTASGSPLLRSRNLLVRLGAYGAVAHMAEIEYPRDWPAPLYPKILGFEDCRLFEWNGSLWVIASIRETHADGFGRMITARLAGVGTDAPRFADTRIVEPGGKLRDQKNWMPLVDGDRLSYVSILDPMQVLDQHGTESAAWPQRHALGHVMRGGSQFVRLDGGWLGVAHEQLRRAGRLRYVHRLVWLDGDCRLLRLSSRFFFVDRTIEFAAGLCATTEGNAFTVSFGVADREAHLGTFAADDARAALDDGHPDLADVVAFAPSPR